MIIPFDAETRPKNGGAREFSLQPWRVQQGTAEISYAAMLTSSDDRWTYPKQCNNIIEWANRGFNSENTYIAWNAVFDVAWLLASGCKNIEKCHFEDVMLLWKHVYTTNPKQENYKLARGVEAFLSDWPFKDEYLALKQREIDNNFETDETEEYNYLDAQVTLWIYNILRPQLSKSQEIAYLAEQATIVAVAKSWISGMPLSRESGSELHATISKEMAELEDKLGLNATTLRSRRMASIMYGDTSDGGWECPVRHMTDTGNPSVGKDAMAFGAKDHSNVPVFAAWKKLNTMMSKFASSVDKILDYTTDGRMYAQPWMNSAKTARFTYSSATTIKHTHHFKNGSTAIRETRHQSAWALHQVPREKTIKRLCVAPEGYKIVEFDASGQESRIMAVKSGCSELIRLFNEGIDTHSFLGAKIVDIPYDEFIESYREGIEMFAGPQGYRMLGKVGNLSCGFRIGKAKFQIKALTDYGVPLSVDDAADIIYMYKQTYPGVVDYWGWSAIEARQKGYAESLAGRRMYLTDWQDRDGWTASQSAINFPIQATGADQKYLALWHMSMHYPDFEFFLDLHDGLYFFVKDNDELVPRCKEAKKMLNNLDYDYYWGVDMPIAMLWDCSAGYNRGEMVDIDSL